MVAKDDNPDKSESGDKPEKQTTDENEAEKDEDKQTSREQEQIDEVSLRSCSELRKGWQHNEILNEILYKLADWKTRFMRNKNKLNDYI